LETYFTPPDRRGGESPSQPVTRGGLGIIGTKLLPRRGERELPLPADVEWRAAVARAGEMSKQEDERLKKLGLATDGIMRLRLDENGQPRALGLVLGSKINELPQGWRMVVARAAVTMEVSGPEAIAPALLGELRAAAREHLKARGLPPLAAVGPVFARLDRERPAEGPLQLLLPLLPD
ncbi:MAG: hypothetical protein QF411_01250, partial [Planctomycetota bacterium]|nr:hypothetical protein [Planctomycetota bacterium]